MQGTLNEIDIRSILQLIELGQRTGELLVEAYPIHSRSLRETVCAFEVNSCERQFWFVFFINGQIIYATDHSNNNLSRLSDYLYRYKVQKTLNQWQSRSLAATNVPEYAYLWLLLEKHLLTPAQGRSIIENMVQETLFDLLSLHQGVFIFQMGTALAPQLITLEIAPLLTKIMQQVQQWKQFYPQIQFPQQCLVISDEAKLRTAVPEQVYQSLSRWVDGKTSLRQLSRYLNRDLLTIARAIYPYLERGWLQLIDTSFKRTSDLQPVAVDTAIWVPRIVCIDDDMTIGKTVEEILRRQGYELTLSSEPLQALSLVFQLKPDLILCNIAMPQLDGYDICAMLRRSTAFRQTPIILLTGQETFINRVRARMVGATDYLSKPFTESELLLFLEKYLGLVIANW